MITDKADLLFVSAGMLAPKKRDHPLARQHRYLNYGLLGLATIAARAGYLCRVVHGFFEPPEQVAQRLTDEYCLDDKLPLLLSLPSCFALEWARRFCGIVRRQRPRLRIVAGGRWVIAGDDRWIKTKIPEIDLAVGGTCESRILELISANSNAGWLINTNASDPSGPILDYALLEDPHDFQPSIEVSRGCGMGCSFCAEKAVVLEPLRSPQEIILSYRAIQRVLKRDDIHPYFECSFFRPTTAWSVNLKDVQREAGVSFSWRTESRVDSFTPETLDVLATTGLKVLDLGLESASPRQLLRMKKTRNPDVYLRRASKLLEHCSSLGIWVKVNLLLYAGETPETIAETCAWLERHRMYFKGVSVNPLTVYRSGMDDQPFLHELEQYGATTESPDSLEMRGFTALHLSRSIDAGEAARLCSEISRRFMTGRDYFDLKAFSYFKPDFSFEKFLCMASSSERDLLPFSID